MPLTLRRACAARSALSLACLLSASAAARAVNIDQYAFSQLDWYQGATPVELNSLWGRLDLDFTPDPAATYYLNVVANAAGSPNAWIVQNYPVFPVFSGAPTAQTVYFDLSMLGLSSGENLTTLNAYLHLAPAALTTPPPGTFAPQTVADQDRIATGHNGSLASPGVPAGHQGVGEATLPIQHQAVPAVQEHVDNCITGAYARSIKWLDNQYDLANLPAATTAQQVYETLNGLGVGHGSGAGNTEEQMLTIKANYLHSLDARAYTKFLDVSNDLGTVPGATEITTPNLLDWLARELATEDVELCYDSHCITITGYYKQSSQVYLRYRDDEHQSNPPDAIGDSREKEGLLTFSGGRWLFDNAQIDYIVSESVPEPATLLLALGGLAVGFARRPLRRRYGSLKMA